MSLGRKTGYKIWPLTKHRRLRPCGRSRKPHRSETNCPKLERTLSSKREKPYWGAPKIQTPDPGFRMYGRLREHSSSSGSQRPGELQKTATDELHCPTARIPSWSADFKGEFMLGDKRYCYPQAITPAVICSPSTHSVKERGAFPVFEEPFKCGRTVPDGSATKIVPSKTQAIIAERPQ